MTDTPSKGDYHAPQEKFDTDDPEVSLTQPGIAVGWRRCLNEAYWQELLVACLAEVIGTAIFIYVAILANLTQDLFAIAFGAGGAIVAVIVMIVNISGANLNPAVSFGFMLVGDISFLRFIFYTISQVIGSLLAAFTARAILSQNIVLDAARNVNITEFEQINGGAIYMQGGITPGLGILAEASYCFCLMAVIYSSAVDTKTKSPLFPVAVGLIVISCVLAGMKNTGASFNPARVLGPAVAIMHYRPDVWDHHYVYWVGPFIGSALATLIYRVIFADSQHTIRRQVIKLV